MTDRDPAQFLPWMCAGLVLSVELWMKGPATAIVVGTSSLVMFAFILAALNLYKSVGGEPAEELAPIKEARRNEIEFTNVHVPPATLLSTPRTQDSR